MTILNRLRGTYSWFVFISGFALYGIVYSFSNMHLALMVMTGYVLGESMGWGKWIGGIINGNTIATPNNLAEKEGTKNGIHFLANLIAPQINNYQHYCMAALAIRGFYWAFLTILPLAFFGYIDYCTLYVTSLLLAIAFPLSIIIGKHTTFTFNFYYFKVNNVWERSEVLYGLAQDIAIISLLLL